MGTASSARDPGVGRKRTVVVRKWARLEPWRGLSAWDRNALSRRSACADLYRGLKRQIETLRWERQISGYVITELNDVQWELNGLMDVRNHARAFAGKLAELQRPWLVIAQAARTAVRVGERFEVSVRLAGAAAPPDGARLAWRFADESGEAALGPDPTTIAVSVVDAHAIAIVPLELEARDGKGGVLSRNALELCVVPPLGCAAPALFPIDAAASRALDAIGWPNLATVAAEADVLIAARLTTPNSRSADRRPQNCAHRQFRRCAYRPGTEPAAQ